MNETMSTTKEKEVIWEENDSTQPLKKSASQPTNDVCDITCATKNWNGNVPSTVTTKISGIYKIVNKVNGKYYVGSSRNLTRRWESHQYYLNKNIHCNTHLQAAWNKYGRKNFSFEIIQRIEPENLLTEEQYYLDKARIEPYKYYNSTYIAGGGWNFPPEIMKKIRKNHKYYSGVENPRYGTHLSKKTKQKISIRLNDRILSAETRTKMRNSKTGIKRSKDFCIKNSINKMGSKNHNYDKNAYTFINKNTNEICRDTQYNFQKRFKLDQRNVSKLIHKKVKSVKGWKLNMNNISI